MENREWWIRKMKEVTGGVAFSDEEMAYAGATQQEEVVHVIEHSAFLELKAEALKLAEALEKIADPTKRDHKEPDAYTTLGCVMHIAEEASTNWRRYLEGK